MLYPDEYLKENSGGYRPGRENMVLCIIIMMLETILPQPCAWAAGLDYDDIKYVLTHEGGYA